MHIVFRQTGVRMQAELPGHKQVCCSAASSCPGFEPRLHSLIVSCHTSCPVVSHDVQLFHDETVQLFRENGNMFLFNVVAVVVFLVFVVSVTHCSVGSSR